jgi:uncharacterized protein
MNKRLLATDVFTATLDPEALPSEQIAGGAPTTGVLEFGAVADAEVGIWEMTEGVARDIEADEIFVVLSGAGTVEFDDGSVLELAPGGAARLRAGERTVWTITERLRKVYVSVT